MEEIAQLKNEIESLKKEIDEKSNNQGTLSSLIDESTLKQMNDFNDIANENMIYCIVDKNLNVREVSKAFSDILDIQIII